MISKSKIRKIILLILLIWYSVELAQAGEQITLSPDGSHSNQNQINEALKKGNVYLGPGVYEITGPIYVQRNTIFSGDSNAKILVSSDISSPWFSPTVGVVNVLDPYNIQITGFEIDGNCQNLNPIWANSPGHAHDQEQLIKIAGSSSNFGNNILIANMKLHNSFGDGIQARFIDGIICSDNTIINTQHECIYFKLCKNCKMLKNQMAVITSDGGRFDNCYNGEAEGNIVWKYDGANNNGAYKGGANGFQVGDAGSSKGYDARTNLIHTENIEIHNNTIIDPGRESIVVDAAGQRPSTNVYLHNNIFVDTEEVKRMGISVSDDISVNNPPSIEMSEKVFSSIFDIFSMNFYTQVGENDTVILPNGVKESPIETTGTIEFYEMGNSTYTLISVPLDGLSEVQYEVNGIEETHTVMIGEYTKNGVLFTETDIWDGELPHEGNALKLSGKVDPSDIKVKCITPKGEFEPDFKTATVEFKPLKIHPAVILIFIAILIFIMFIRTSLKHML